jgi:23S rRNA pseudouridine1911/1915/1917 synthase
MSAKKPAGPALPAIIYEDEALLVVNKPAGLLVIPSPKGETNTLGSLVNRMLLDRAAALAPPVTAAGGNPPATQAWPCHRIDRETSGIMVYAKGKAMQKKVMELFHRRAVKKVYLALVNGCPGKAAGSIRTPLEGQEAITHYQLLGGNERFAAVRAMPETGRTNQIRIHFARMGHPLLGDAKFGIRKEFKQPFKRTALHAWRLDLVHPASGLPLSFVAPLPPDLLPLLDSLGLAGLEP